MGRPWSAFPSPVGPTLTCEFDWSQYISRARWGSVRVSWVRREVGNSRLETCVRSRCSPWGQPGGFPAGTRRSWRLFILHFGGIWTRAHREPNRKFGVVLAFLKDHSKLAEPRTSKSTVVVSVLVWSGVHRKREGGWGRNRDNIEVHNLLSTFVAASSKFVAPNDPLYIDLLDAFTIGY